MTVLILHLSDAHIKNELDPVVGRASSIASCLFSALPNASAVFVVFSGDIAFSGEKEQYDVARNFLTQLRASIEAEKKIPVHFVIAPGNHDCDFSREDEMRRIAIKHLGTNKAKIDESVINTCTSVQEPFFDFCAGLQDVQQEPVDKLWQVLSFDLDGKRVVFDVLNVSWVSRLHEEPGGLTFPYERYHAVENQVADLRILVMHHPLNWFSQSVYRPFRSFVRKVANIIITGHEHQGNAGENLDTESAHSAYIEGAVLQGHHDLTDSSFYLLEIKLDEAQYCSTRYRWNKSLYEAAEEGSWADYRDLPIKQSNPLEVTKDFRAILDDPGANFQHPTASVGLSDIYVYPDLHELSSSARGREFISSSVLLDPARTSNGVLLEGDEKSGATSLLYRLYDEYHDRGYVPLLLRGRDIKRTAAQIDALIVRAVREQYGERSLIFIRFSGHIARH